MNPRENALQPLPIDSRDFSHSRVFGSVAINDLPSSDFLVSVPMEIKDQDINYNSDFCTSYAAAEVDEDIDQVIMLPEWSFAQAKYLLSQKQGQGVLSQFGLNLRDICNAGVKLGFLPKRFDPFHCDTMERPDRNFLADANNWPISLYAEGARYKKPSYFAVDGPHDTFDNIRAVMWKNLGTRNSIIVGASWRGSWTVAKDGIIPTEYEAQGSGHAFKICGQKTIDGEIYLVAQMSDGISFGDNGFCYFPRLVVNKEFTFGLFCFNHMPPDTALWHVTTGVSIHDSFALKIWKIISKYINL